MPTPDHLPTIVSSDTLREQRLPPGQSRTRKWPVLHEGTPPPFDPATWDFCIDGLVRQPWRATWHEFRALPIVQVKADMHCVTRWSQLDMLWEGVAIRELLAKVEPSPLARFVLVRSYGGYTTNLPLDDLLGEDCLLAWAANGEPLTPDHGGPLRLVVPKLYAWKSAKWVRGIELMADDKPGYWEQLGYHLRGDPWSEERFGVT